MYPRKGDGAVGPGTHPRVHLDHLFPVTKIPQSHLPTLVGMIQDGQRPRGAGISNTLWPGRRRKRCQINKSVKANVGEAELLLEQLAPASCLPGWPGIRWPGLPRWVGELAPHPTPPLSPEPEGRVRPGREVVGRCPNKTSSQTPGRGPVHSRGDQKSLPQGKDPSSIPHQLLQPKPKCSLGLQGQDSRPA